MWICEYIVDGWSDKPRDGYLVYIKGTDKQKSGYGYYPSGKQLAEKFAKLCNRVGEKEACQIMGYKEPNRVSA